MDASQRLMDSPGQPIDEARAPASDRAALTRRLFAPVTIAPLVCFRVAFGVILFWEVLRYFAHGWIEKYYITPALHFTFYGFDWVRPWPGVGMYLHFVALGVLALGILFGLWYRVCAALFFLGFTYVFLLDQARYLNHFYLISLVSLLLIFVPAGRALSLDARARPSMRAGLAPTWALWLLRGQIGLVYFFGGVAKLNGDWLHGQPMRLWLAESTDFPLIGSLFTDERMVLLFSYGGLLLDLFIFPALLWRRTRPMALAAALSFHLLNARLFSIGIFPWFMIAATFVLFLPPDFWGRFARWLPAPTTPQPDTPARRQRLIIALLSVYFGFQIGLPLRHWLYPGDVNWTEEGHLYAWHMKLRDKQGDALFYVTAPDSEAMWEIDPHEYVTDQQYRELVTEPDMILQFSHHLADLWRQRGYTGVEVRALVSVSLNGRPPQLLVDPM